MAEAAARPVTPGKVLLETRGLVKSFRGFAAVDGVDFCLRQGEVHALIGPNGAGKTTFFHLLTKFLAPSAGSIHFDGTDITHEQPARTAQRGIVRSFQISAVFGELTALQNVRVALQRPHGLAHQFWRGGRSLRTLDAQAFELLRDVGLERHADRRAGDLAYGQKRALELATTLSLAPRLMLLDEPTQGMGHEDVAAMAQLIRRVAHGRTVLMVEHNMRVVAGICDSISVLQRGRLIAQGRYEDVARDPRVVEAYMGDAHASLEAAHA